MNAPVCPYCHASAELRDWPDAPTGNMWVCPTDGCDSTVGITQGDPLPWPNGTMANGDLRRLRGRLHAIYTARLAKTPQRRLQRANMQAERRRINYMDDETCRRVLMELVEESMVTK